MDYIVSTGWIANKDGYIIGWVDTSYKVGDTASLDMFGYNQNFIIIR